jgi:hypothetical protein
MDGMDQSHSRIPYLGSAISLSESLTMHVEGVNDHGSKGKNKKFYFNLHGTIYLSCISYQK